MHEGIARDLLQVHNRDQDVDLHEQSEGQGYYVTRRIAVVQEVANVMDRQNEMWLEVDRSPLREEILDKLMNKLYVQEGIRNISPLIAGDVQADVH